MFGATGAITGAVSKGVTALSMDDAYIARQQRRRGNTSNAATGFMSGMESMGMVQFACLFLSQGVSVAFCQIVLAEVWVL